MILKCIIVDDEPMARSFLEKFCEKDGKLLVTGSFADAESALAHLKINETDILFLDIEMPGINGFQLLDQLVYSPKIILTTSKTDYAFEAFQYNVTDYLKKPIQYNRFQDALGKIKDSFQTTVADTQQVDMFIKADGKFIRINYQDILYIESIGDYVKYITSDKNYLTHSTLKAVEEKMDKLNFMKVHRSYIVNMRKIKDIQDYTIVIDGKVIPISKSLKGEVMERLNIA